MDLRLTPDEVELQRSVRRSIERQGGGLPLHELDVGSLRALLDGGLLDVLAHGGRPLDAVLVVEEAARLGVCAPVAARAFIAPSLLDGELPDVIGLAASSDPTLVRWGHSAELLLVLGEEAHAVPAASAVAESVRVRWGYPAARVVAPEGSPLGPGSGARLRRLWRIAIAAEAGGLMAGAVGIAVEHVSTRVQFGRPIGMYQSIQHRLAAAHILAQGTMWLARRAAWDTANEELAAAAATYAAKGMREVVMTTQGVCGAIGLTDEFGLTRYTAAMLYLQTELGGSASHAGACGRARYDVGQSRSETVG